LGSGNKLFYKLVLAHGLDLVSERETVHGGYRNRAGRLTVMVSPIFRPLNSGS
jgi:hypothetical protein